MNHVEFTLQLVPLTTNGEAFNQSEDDWLENDNQHLLTADGLDIATPIKTDNHESSRGNFYKVLQINIKKELNHFLLMTENGNIILADEDRLCVADVTFLVKLVKQQIVVNPDPNVDSVTTSQIDIYDDIWATDITPEALPHHKVADPFHSNVMNFDQRVDDPLNFLTPGYSPQASNQVSALLPTATDHLDHYNQQLGLNSNYEDIVPHAIDPLAINSDYNYQPISTHANLVSRDQSRPPQDMSQGNILNDLGISNRQTMITDSDKPIKSSTFQEQSPYDMLDEFLEQEEDFPLLEQASPLQLAHVNQSVLPDLSYSPASPSASQTGFVTRFKSFTRKIFS